MFQLLFPTAVMLVTLYWLYKPTWDAKQEKRKAKREYPSGYPYDHQRRNAAGHVKLDVTENFYHDN
jgi:hypothetical protein